MYFLGGIPRRSRYHSQKVGILRRRIFVVSFASRCQFYDTHILRLFRIIISPGCNKLISCSINIIHIHFTKQWLIIRSKDFRQDILTVGRTFIRTIYTHTLYFNPREARKSMVCIVFLTTHNTHTKVGQAVIANRLFALLGRLWSLDLFGAAELTRWY